MIQKRITTVDSCHPSRSKWWWIGAILKTRLPVSLKEVTCTITETVSVIVQVVSFKTTGKRVFKMAPIHHHFERLGWQESTVVIRFWIISIVLALAGLATLKLR